MATYSNADKRNPIKNHPILTIVILLVLVALGWYFLHDAKGGKGKKPTPVPVVAVAPVTHKDVPVYLDGLGTVQAYNTVTIHSQIDGKLVEVAFKEGQDVHAGDVLARIDPRTYQAQYDQAMATKAKDVAMLENARRDLQRYINVGNTISGQTLDTQRSTVRQAEAAVQADQANIENAQTQLSYATITSPIDGRTGIRQVDVGNIVHTGDTNGLVVITQMEPISVLFSLPQQNLPDVTRNLTDGKQLVVQAMDTGNRNVLDEGKLELIDNQIDQTTGTIKLKSTFPNSKRQLWPGGFINIRLMLTTRLNSMVVPAAAIQRGPQTTYVFVLKDDHTVEIRPIKLAMTVGQDAVIDEGLKDGEQVITDGAGKLLDGTKVSLPGEKSDKDGDTAKTDAPADKPEESKADGTSHKHGGKKHDHSDGQ